MLNPVLQLLCPQHARAIALRELDEALRERLHVRARPDERPEVDALSRDGETARVGLEIEHALLELVRGGDQPFRPCAGVLLVADLGERDDQNDEDGADEGGEDRTGEEHPPLKASLHRPHFDYKTPWQS